MKPLSAIVLLAICVASALQFPALAQAFALPALPLARLWLEPEAQYRAALGNVPYAALRAADAALPREARVLLVTDGRDVRAREYTTFHRALYWLTPRAVVWLSPAPHDGTWQARWWHSAPLRADTLLQWAHAQQLDYVLIFAPVPSALQSKIMFQWQNGALLRLTSRAENANGTRVEFRGLDGVWRAAGALAILFGIGALAVYVAVRAGYALKRGEALVLAWLGGAALISFWLVGALLSGLELSTAVALLFIPAAFGYILNWRAMRRSVRAVFQAPRPRWQWLATFVLALPIFFVAWVSSAQPLRVWDSWVLWGMKARTIFVTQTLSPAVFAEPTRAVTHLNYPLLLPLTEAYFFQWLAAPDDRWLGVVATFYFVALVAEVFYGVRRLGGDSTRAWLAAGAVAFMPGLALLSASVYADVPLAAYATMAMLALAEWCEHKSRGALWIAMGCCACLPWMKREGWVLVASMLLALILLAPRRAETWRAVVACGAGALLGAGGWDIFLARHDVSNPMLLPVTLETLYGNLERAPRIGFYFLREFINPQWSLVLPLAGIMIVTRLTLTRTRILAPRALLLLAPLLYLGAMACGYFFSAYAPLSAHLANSGYRLVAQVTPPVVVWLAVHDL
jgi:hypothetical protein